MGVGSLKHGFYILSREDYEGQRESEVRNRTIIRRRATNRDPNVLATSSNNKASLYESNYTLEHVSNHVSTSSAVATTDFLPRIRLLDELAEKQIE